MNYEPRYSRREKPLSARFRIGQVCRAGPLPYRASRLLFSARTATPRIGLSHFRAFLLCILVISHEAMGKYSVVDGNLPAKFRFS